jgi:hypothetical protein
MFKIFLLVILSSLIFADDQPDKPSITISSTEGVQKLGDEIIRLQKIHPTKYQLFINIISDDISAWYEPERPKNSRIINLKPNTKEIMIKELRHEWCHMIQEQEGRLTDKVAADIEARKVE